MTWDSTLWSYSYRRAPDVTSCSAEKFRGPGVQEHVGRCVGISNRPAARILALTRSSPLRRLRDSLPGLRFVLTAAKQYVAIREMGHSFLREIQDPQITGDAIERRRDPAEDTRWAPYSANRILVELTCLSSQRHCALSIRSGNQRLRDCLRQPATPNLLQRRNKRLR